MEVAGMQIPLQITSRSFPLTEAIETAIHEKVAKLTQFYDRIISCHVTLDTVAKGHQQGQLYHVQVDLKVPGRDIVVNRNPTQDHAHEDLYVALRDAFNAAKRQLQDYVDQLPV
jgi:ribosomal subunit interface protein